MAKRGRRATGHITETSPGSWSIRWRERGQRRSAGRLPSREVAERLLAKVLGEVAQGLPGVPQLQPLAVPPPRREDNAAPPAALAELAPLLREGGFGMERAPGVYFLVRGSDVVYVGQSANVRTRLGQHMGALEFDRALWLTVEFERLPIVERALIALLRPPLNREMFELTHARWNLLGELGVRRRPAA